MPRIPRVLAHANQPLLLLSLLLCSLSLGKSILLKPPAFSQQAVYFSPSFLGPAIVEELGLCCGPFHSALGFIHSFIYSLVHNAVGNRQPVLRALENKERVPTVCIFGPGPTHSLWPSARVEFSKIP